MGMCKHCGKTTYLTHLHSCEIKPKEWQGLSDEEIKNIFVEYADLGGDIPMNACYDIYCDIERLLKEKNI